MRKTKVFCAIALAIATAVIGWLIWRSLRTATSDLAGSGACRDCHQTFYHLWSTSFHGLAMQPVNSSFLKKSLSAHSEQVKIGDFYYQALISDTKGWILERGDESEKQYPIEYALGGKNVFYFLTPLDRGRLQVLPLAYHVRTRSWVNTTESMVRHFPSGDMVDAPLHWTDRLLTFNTSCYGCHVSQVSHNYDPNSDSYRTTWTEPGISCETCHGPGAEHVRLYQQVEPGQSVDDPQLIALSRCTVEENNDICGSCHAKAVPITTKFSPKEQFFDHFDLATLEHPDFYPDGRDLGENYTLTSWRMSACATSGRLDCIKCHTSSGRYRFREREKANEACLPCHEDKVKTPSSHTHHPADSEGSICIRCHMPMTEFALMRRSDHSMRPPSPAATIEFKSPNACNSCHSDKTPQWADRHVRLWHKRDYQAPLLKQARLVAAARQQDWSRLPQMLEYLASQDREEIFVTSLIRLLVSCPDDRKWPVLLAALDDPSPLVRSAAATGLRGGVAAPEIREALFRATGDDVRLVRIRAGMALAPYPADLIPEASRRQVEAAWNELEAALQTRPDDWAMNNLLGNFWLDRSQPHKARLAFERATRLRPDSSMSWVNLSIACARLSDNDAAESALRRALGIDPNNSAAQFNLALLMAEKGQIDQAEKLLRDALKTDPSMPEAAYNLGALLAGKGDEAGALYWCRRAASLRPQEPRYGYTVAFYLREAGRMKETERVLQEIIRRHPEYIDAYLLLAESYESQGQKHKARDVYSAATRLGRLDPQQRLFLESKLREGGNE
ncbi:MAG: tetratricopeptide repeat protein [Acidobacteriota bacterium]